MRWRKMNILIGQCEMIIPLADTRVEERSLITWICSDQKQVVTLLDARDTAV